MSGWDWIVLGDANVNPTNKKTHHKDKEYDGSRKKQSSKKTNTHLNFKEDKNSEH